MHARTLAILPQVRQDVLVFALRGALKRDDVILECRDGLRNGLDTRRLGILERSKFPYRPLPIAGFQGMPISPAIDFAITPDRAGALRVEPALLPMRAGFQM